MSIHSDQRKYQCDKCDKSFISYDCCKPPEKSHNCEQVIPHNSRNIHPKRCKKENTRARLISIVSNPIKIVGVVVVFVVILFVQKN